MAYRPRKNRPVTKTAVKKAAPRKSQVQKEAERKLIETDSAQNERYNNQAIHELFSKYTGRIRDLSFVHEHAPFESNIYNGLGVSESFVRSLIQLAWTIFPETLRSSYHGKTVEMASPKGWMPLNFLKLADNTQYCGSVVMLTMDRINNQPDIFDELLSLPMVMGTRAVTFTGLALALNLYDLSQESNRSVEEQDLLERMCGYYMGRIAAQGLIFRCGFISMAVEQNVEAEEAMFKHVDERFQSLLDIADAKDALANPNLDKFEEALIQASTYGQIGAYVRMGFLDTMGYFDDLMGKHPELLTEPLDSLTHKGSKINLTSEDGALVVRVNYKATRGQRQAAAEYVRPIEEDELEAAIPKETKSTPKPKKERTMSAATNTVTRRPRASTSLANGAGRTDPNHQKTTFMQDVQDFGARTKARTETQIRRGANQAKNVFHETIHNKKRLVAIGVGAAVVVGTVMLINHLNNNDGPALIDA